MDSCPMYASAKAPANNRFSLEDLPQPVLAAILSKAASATDGHWQLGGGGIAVPRYSAILPLASVSKTFCSALRTSASLAIDREVFASAIANYTGRFGKSVENAIDLAAARSLEWMTNVQFLEVHFLDFPLNRCFTGSFLWCDIVVHSLTSLHLELGHSWQILDERHMKAVCCLRNLTELRISWGGLSSTVSEMETFEPLQQLRLLSLRHCMLADSHLALLLAVFPAIKHLTLDSCQTLKYPVISSAELKTLHFRGSQAFDFLGGPQGRVANLTVQADKLSKLGVEEVDKLTVEHALNSLQQVQLGPGVHEHDLLQKPLIGLHCLSVETQGNKDQILCLLHDNAATLQELALHSPGTWSLILSQHRSDGTFLGAHHPSFSSLKQLSAHFLCANEDALLMLQELLGLCPAVQEIRLKFAMPESHSFSPWLEAISQIQKSRPDLQFSLPLW